MSPVWLHIGGTAPRPGWTIVNVVDGPQVDVCADAGDLAAFTDGGVARIYASHVLEHLGYQTGVGRCLQEWFRALAPGGELRISVPDLETLCRLFTAPKRTYAERYHLMRMIMGGQMDAHDLHRTGFFEPLLVDFLQWAGFVGIERVDQHGLFDDASGMRVDGQLISLNVVAHKPPD